MEPAYQVPRYIPITAHHAIERRAPRRPLHGVVKIHQDGYAHRCHLIEASATGMLIELSRSLSTRDERLIYDYELWIDDGPLAVTGRTVWRRGRLQAVRFITLWPEEIARLSSILGLERGACDVARIEAAERLDRWSKAARAA